jgi:large repetitive protein
MERKLIYSILLVGFLGASCQPEDKKSSEKDIITFRVNNQVGESTINSVNNTIGTIVEKGTNLSTIIPTFIISEGATSNPSSGTSVDFSGGTVNFEVTAEDHSTKNWQVSVDTALSSEAKIVSFKVENQLADFVIGDSTIAGEINKKMDIKKVSPVITISLGASIRPASGVETDFSGGPVVYTVTAEDGTQKKYNTTISKVPNNEALIKSVTIEGMVGTPSLYAGTYTVHMPFGSDLTNLTPIFTLSTGATITPGIWFSPGFFN